MGLRHGDDRRLRRQVPGHEGWPIIGTLILTIGVALFATFSGFLAQAFLSNNADRPTTLADGSAQAALAAVERLLAEQQAATETLRARLLERARLNHPPPVSYEPTAG